MNVSVTVKQRSCGGIKATCSNDVKSKYNVNVRSDRRVSFWCHFSPTFIQKCRKVTLSCTSVKVHTSHTLFYDPRLISPSYSSIRPVIQQAVCYVKVWIQPQVWADLHTLHHFEKCEKFGKDMASYSIMSCFKNEKEKLWRLKLSVWKLAI